MSLHPVLMCRDVAVSVRFYERLGFSKTFIDRPLDPQYAGIVRDGLELHLQRQDESQWEHPIDRPTYRFVVTDVDALFAEYQLAGVVEERVVGSSPWIKPGDTPWGTREFHLRDPDGNGLQFYCAL